MVARASTLAVPPPSAATHERAVRALAIELRRHHAPTAAHSNRLAALCRALCRLMELGPTEATQVELVAVLHDIGKLFVPVALLEKRGPLDPGERTSIETHVVLGSELLARTAGLEHLEPLVRATHERWDGGGYPDGLAGGAIPLAARLVACADAFDAMTRTRPYRPALAPAEARRRIAEERGAQFDPRVTDVLLGLVDHG